jgi:UDP-4-amino-4,6-dideoxy-N-acetyl-beta-L-altrosamine N-acetyltransferase
MINTKRLSIVPLEREDIEPLRLMRNDPTTRHWLSDTSIISKEAQEKWFNRLVDDSSRLYLAIKDKKNKLVGVLRSDQWDRINHSVRVGLDIHPDFRGKGLGTEAFQGFIDYLFNEQGMHRLWLLVAENNEIAIRLYARLGFSTEGKMRDALLRDGKYLDYCCMSIVRKDF